MHLFYTPDIASTNLLPEEEARHCLRVLRLTAGDEVMLTDGKGNFYVATIALATGKQCLVEISRTIAQPALWQGHLHVAMAPTKSIERTEWFAEKATEIGLDELTFLDCRFSERRTVKTERIEKILVAAMKQSLKARLPRLNPMTDFDRFICTPRSGQKFIAHCYETEKPLLQNLLKTGEDAVVLIGPEGDFSQEEVQRALSAGYQAVSLSASRLRTETAALVACHLMAMAASPSDVSNSARACLGAACADSSVL
jgi:16S rRNA (uracil1498-N3)-methyltransferase